MQGFEDVTIGWGGVDYTIPSERQLMLVAKIEDALGGEAGDQAIAVLLRPAGPPMSRMASAYGAALRMGGAQVTNEEVYLAMMAGLGSDKAGAVSEMQGYILAMLSVVSPPMGKALSLAPQKKTVSKSQKSTAKG